MRCDRNKKLANKSKGGGILLAINNSIPSYNVKLVSSSLYERIDLIIHKNNIKLFVSLVYFPQNIPAGLYLEYTNSLLQFIDINKIENILIIGDFNLAGYKWSAISCDKNLIGFHQSPSIRESANIIYNLMKNLKLNQMNSFINYANNTLDLFLCNNSNKMEIMESIDPLLMIDPAHSAHNIIYPVKNSTNMRKIIHKYNYNLGDYKNLSKEINEFNWFELYNNTKDVNIFLKKFYDLLLISIEKHIPKTIEKQSRFPLYFSIELIKAIINKRVLHYMYKITLSPYFLTEFKNHRTLCKNLKTRDYNNLITKIDKKLLNNPRDLWKYVNSKDNQKGYPKEMYLDNSHSNSESIIADLFSNYFKGFYIDKRLDNYSSQTYTNNILDCIIITSTDIINTIKTLKCNTSSGPDTINPIVVKNCSDAMIEPLFILFSNMLQTGIYPDELKKSFIIPIFKSGDKSDIRNYRPISIINVFSKIFEKILFNKINSFIYEKIISEQHGGIPGKSILSNLTIFNDYVGRAFYDNYKVVVTYLDASKAFDRVVHSLLINKLSQYGIKGMLLEIISSYLSNR